MEKTHDIASLDTRKVLSHIPSILKSFSLSTLIATCQVGIIAVLTLVISYLGYYGSTKLLLHKTLYLLPMHSNYDLDRLGAAFLWLLGSKYIRDILINFVSDARLLRAIAILYTVISTLALFYVFILYREVFLWDHDYAPNPKYF